MTKGHAGKYILFDTNAIYNDLTLKSERIESLKRYARLTGSIILLPSVLRDEVFKQYRSDWIEAQRSLEKINLKFNGLVEIKHLEDEAMKIFTDSWNRFAADKVVVNIDSAQLNLSELIKRSIAEDKPFGEHSRGFRDALLWLSAMDYLKKQAGSGDFIFISNNNSDFGKQKLFDNLLAEVKNTGRQALYYSNLPSFLTEHMTISNIINDAWVGKIIETRLIEDHLEELIDQRQEEIFPEAYEYIDDEVWSSMLVEDGYRDEGISLEDYAIPDYYVYNEDDDNYYVQLQVLAWINVVIGLATSADYDGLEYEGYTVELHKTFALNAKVAKQTGVTVVV